MKQFRKIIFWCHCVAGVFIGVVVLIMSVTGVLLAYEKQITLWADTRAYRIAPPNTTTRLPVETLVSRASEAIDAAPTSVIFRADAKLPATVTFGRDVRIFINPYTGEVLGEGSKTTRDFFRFVTSWHRWLGAGDDNRAVGRAITGACNLAFLFLIASGLYLWMPRNWTRKQIRNVAWFRRNLSGKARDFNWHNTIGFWSAIPLFIVVLSAVPISYAWASNLVYRIVGETPPPAQQRGPTSQAPAQLPGSPGQSGGNEKSVEIFAGGLDHLLARAERQTPAWQSITLQLPASATAPVTLTIDEGSGGQPHKRAQLTLERASGEVVRYEPFSSYSRGRQLRSFLRFAHTGEVAGLIGQSIAGLVSLGSAFLVWTGLSLAWRRFSAWRSRRSDSFVETVSAPETR